ncbi:MAG: hypothetical protein PVI66_14700 [Candidatus Aminicenantes bacterium]|jgi:hypothetical protein
MSDCEKYRNMFVDALYEELSTEDNPILKKHLRECDSCRNEHDELAATMDTMSQRIRPEPDPEFFGRYWDRLAKRMDKERVARTAGIRWWESIFTRRRQVFPRWAYQAVASVLLVVVGIFLGRMVFTPAQVADQPVSMVQAVTAPGPQINVSQRAFDYIQRSKLIVLAISNFDPENQDPYALDLPYQQQVSRELVQEASWLKEELSGRRQRRLQELVSDLEIILLQIANLEADSDISAIELVQDGVKSRGILFKIHLAQYDDGSKAPLEAERALDKSKSF